MPSAPDRAPGPDADTPATAPAVSVVVPNLDSPLVDRTLEALAAQGAPGPGVEVLVVGRDAHGKVPRGGTHPHAPRFVETAERLNPAAARNRGVAEARGTKILFTDADCKPLPGWIEHLSRALDTVPVAGGAVTFPHDGNRWALADNIASFHELLADRPIADPDAVPLGSLNLAVTRETWETVGGFDEELTTSEDMDWVLRARAAGRTARFVPAAVVEHAAVRRSADDVRGHARWYGRNLHDFRRRHPEALATGPTWSSRRRLALAAPLKTVTSSLGIFLRHPSLRRLLPRALPGVLLFKWAWYRAVLDTWPEAEPERER